MIPNRLGPTGRTVGRGAARCPSAHRHLAATAEFVHHAEQAGYRVGSPKEESDRRA